MFRSDSIYAIYDLPGKYEKLLRESNRQYLNYQDKIDNLENQNKELELKNIELTKEIEKLKEHISNLEKSLNTK